MVDRPSPQPPPRTLHSYPQTVQPSSCWGPTPFRSNIGSSSPDNASYRIRLDPPRLDGTDTQNWIRNIHYYFNHMGTPEEQRLQFVIPLFDSPAADWIWNYCESHTSVSWLEFLDDVRQRFDQNYYQNYVGLLSKLTQTGTVAEYQASFEALQNNVSGLSETSHLAIFIAGLRQPLQGELQLHQPTSLSAAFALAKHLDACRPESSTTVSTAPRRSWPPRNSRPLATSAPPSTASAQPPNTVPRPPSGTSRPLNLSKLPIVRLSSAEKTERSHKGLCRYCDEKWIAGHVCKHRFLAYMGGDDDDEDLCEPDAPFNLWMLFWTTFRTSGPSTVITPPRRFAYPE